jgi:CheY-like chemotaxis protein
MPEKQFDINILLIDDSEIDLFLYRKLFSKYYGLPQIASYANSQEALKKIEYSWPTNPTILILDINMPVVSGFDILEKLSVLPQKVLDMYTVYVVTSSTNRNDHARAAEYSFVKEIIVKPLTSEKVKSFFE